MTFRKKLRDAGKETAINVLDAEVEYYSVLSNMINAEYDSKIAFYRLLFVTGQLTPQNIGLGEGQFRIPTAPLDTRVAEQRAQAVAAAAQAAPAEQAVPVQQATPEQQTAGVRAALDAWAKAWTEKDTEAFIAMHTPDFAPDGLSREAWEKQRAVRLSAPKWIKVELNDVQLEMQPGGRAIARFTQAYSSDRYKDVTSKTLELVQLDGEWKVAAQK